MAAVDQLPIDRLNREDAVARLRAGLSALPNAELRAIAVAAFEILVHAPEASDDLIELAVEDLVTAVPELEPVIALILSLRRGGIAIATETEPSPVVET
jgi:hypothetical protein